MLYNVAGIWREQIVWHKLIACIFTTQLPLPHHPPSFTLFLFFSSFFNHLFCCHTMALLSASSSSSPFSLNLTEISNFLVPLISLPPLAPPSSSPTSCHHFGFKKKTNTKGAPGVLTSPFGTIPGYGSPLTAYSTAAPHPHGGMLHNTGSQHLTSSMPC